MEELTIEEKAKRYDEALKRAKKLQETCDSMAVVGWCEYIFPELKESEDEQIRKWCISHFKSCINVIKDNDEYKEYLSNKVIHWLEKQGKQKTYGQRKECEDCQFNYAGECKGFCQMKRDEQKPTDKVEPKFHEGEWITNGNYTWKIVEVKSLDYILQSQDGNIVNDTISYVDEQFHSFTIKDVKDGDVLAEDSCIFIIQKLGDNNTAAKTYCSLHNDGDFVDGSILYFDIDSTKPATKEQRDLLFQKMADAGYEFVNGHVTRF